MHLLDKLTEWPVARSRACLCSVRARSSCPEPAPCYVINHYVIDAGSARGFNTESWHSSVFNFVRFCLLCIFYIINYSRTFSLQWKCEIFLVKIIFIFYSKRQLIIMDTKIIYWKYVNCLQVFFMNMATRPEGPIRLTLVLCSLGLIISYCHWTTLNSFNRFHGNWQLVMASFFIASFIVFILSFLIVMMILTMFGRSARK